MELFFSSSVMLFLHANSVKAFVKRYVQLLPCFPLLTHNACLTYSSFPECLPSPKIWFLMWRKENQGGAGTFHQTSILNGSPQWVERSQSSFQFHMRKPLREVRNEPFGFDVADSFFLPSSSHESFFAVTDNEKRRLQDAFRRSSAANNNISKQVQAVVRARGIGSPSKSQRYSFHGDYFSQSLGFISLWTLPCFSILDMKALNGK